MEVDEKALGQRLQKARRQAGLTQQELCQKAGLSYSTLAKIERGAIKAPSIFTVAAIASTTNTSVEKLLGIKIAGLGGDSSKKTAKSGVKFVYFDIVGTFVRFYHRAFTIISKDSGSSVDTIETLFWRHNDSVCRGDMSIDKLNSLMAAELDFKGFDWPKYFFAAVESMPGVKELASWAAEHYEVGLLSNIMPGFIDELIVRGLIPKLNYKAVVDSSKVGTIKPEIKIYETAQKMAGVEPKEILFIDDSRANLTAADKLGWRVLWFDGYKPEESIKKIKESLEF